MIEPQISFFIVMTIKTQFYCEINLLVMQLDTYNFIDYIKT